VRKEKRRAEASVKERDSIARDKLLAFVRMRNRFTLAQMARRIERTTTETEAIICELANSGEVDLLYHRANQEYLRRGKIQTTGRVVTQCLSCGSPLKPEILMEGERVDCDYCGLRL